jgi:hypothetical protein
MRSTILGYAGFFLIMIQLLVLGTVITKSCYKQEIEQSVEDSMDLAANLLKEGYVERYAEDLAAAGVTENTSGIVWEGSSLSSWKQEFVTYLADNIDSRITDLSVDFYGSDESQGLLSVSVKAQYEYLNNQHGTVECYKTIVLNTNHV